MATANVSWFDTPSADVVARGSALTSCGHHRGADDYQLKSRRVPEWVVILTTAGTGWCRVDDRSAQLTPGDLVLLPPGSDHGYGTRGEEWHLIWAHVVGPAIPELVGTEDRLRFRWQCDADRTTDLLTSAVTEIAHRRDGYEVAAGGYLGLAIRLALVHSRRLETSTGAQGGDLVIAAQSFIHAHLGEPLTLAAIAAHVHVSPGHLCRVFREATGYTPMDYSIRQRLNQAKTLLGQTDRPIQQIAAETGYLDAGYFARSFRAKTGMSPSVFRRSRFG